MDCTNTNFTINCESNPAFYKKCAVQWMEEWSKSSMKKVSEGPLCALCFVYSNYSPVSSSEDIVRFLNRR